MRKALLVSIVLLLSLFIVSCDDFVFSHSNQKVTVMIVGLDYAPRKKDVAENPISLQWSSYTVGKLQGTINDSKEIGAALDSLYTKRDIEHEMIFMLSEGENPDYSNPLYPNASNVMSRINELEMGKDDLFVFYYAGHGFLNNDELYFITGDRYKGDFCSSIKASDLMEAIKGLGCRTAVLLDACYSGAFDPKNSTTPNTLLNSIKTITKEKIVTGESLNMSVLTASKWNEKSMENYVVSFSNGKKEVHGYFSGRLLSALGWEHSSNAVTKVKNIDGSIIVANGSQGNLFGALSLDDIYSKLFEDREYPDLIQYPVYYYTNETINLVPAN